MIPLKLLVVSLVGFAGNLDGVVLDFSATWCGPCQQMSPIVSKLERDGYPIRKIDIDSNRELARRFNVQSIPAFVLVIDGVEHGRIVGATSEDQLIRFCARVPRQPEGNDSTPERPAEKTPRKAAPRPAASPAGTEVLLADSQSGSSKPGLKLPSLFGGKKPEAPRVLVSRDDNVTRANNDAGQPSRPPVQGNPLAASVRIRVHDAQGEDVGSGTIIDSRIGSTTILTCGHIFRNWDKQARIEIDYFRDGRMESAVGTRLYHHLEDDVGLIALNNVDPLPSCRVAPAGMKIVRGLPVVSVGCSRGDNPTVQTLKITALNRYLGADNIEVGGMPAQGRSGGGLFSKEGQLIGVCSGADAHHREGLYIGPATIQKLLDHCNLAHLYRSNGKGEPGQRLPGKPPVSTEPSGPADFDPEFAETVELADGRKKPRLSGAKAPLPKRQAANSAEEGSELGGDVGGDEGAIREALEQAGEAEIVCIIRPIHQPRAASRVVILNRASRRFVAYLSDEIDAQPDIQETTLKAHDPLPRQLAETQKVKRPASSPVADAPHGVAAASDDEPYRPAGPQPYKRKRPARPLAGVTGRE